MTLLQQNVIHKLHEITALFQYFTEFESEASSWTSTSPPSVKGLIDSCVVIPCSFNYPDEGNEYEFTGIWNNPNGVIFHSGSGQMSQQYQNRVELVGELKGKNCSLKIDPLQISDVGPFDFRIEIKNYDSYSYQNSITISVLSKQLIIFFFPFSVLLSCLTFMSIFSIQLVQI